MTDSGRTVYGWGGITPDEKFVPGKLYDPLEVPISFASTGSSISPASTSRQAPRQALSKGWMPDDAVILSELHDYLSEGAAPQFTEAEFTKDHDWIKRYLAKEMYISAFNVDESDRVASPRPTPK